MTDSTHPDIEWAIKARADIQHDMLALYIMVDANQPLTQGDYWDDPDNKSAFSLFVGASFSLWRAAFLADISGRQSWCDMVDAEKRLLHRVLTHNAISFNNDYDFRAWVFGYYLMGALMRLAEARKHLKMDGEQFAEFDRIYKSELVGISDTPQNLWTVLRNTLVLLTEELKRRVAGQQQ